MSVPQPFQISISDEDIADLHRRIDNTRWPDQLNDDNWSYGTDINYLKELVAYWRNDFDWRAAEARLNSFDHFLWGDDKNLHFIHQRSSHENATPLIITHGWPGSIVEFLDIIEPLTQPEKFGGKPEDAFHVVCPSLPGYGWSTASDQPGMNTEAIAKGQIKLMAELGYDSYLAQGGDWGAMVTRHIGKLDPTHCRGIHLNMVVAFPPKGVEDPMAGVTEAEMAALGDSGEFTKDGMGYFKIQSTRPQTLGYGLADSPVGLCGWLTEKFRSWTDCDGEIRNAISWDTLLTNISLYWFTNTICSSTRLYFEDSNMAEVNEPLDVPTGAAIYPKELVRLPKTWIEASYDIVHFQTMEKGGHFAAMEQPTTFVADLRAFRKTIEA